MEGQVNKRWYFVRSVPTLCVLCVCACVRACAHARASSQISTIALDNHRYNYIYTHTYLCCCLLSWFKPRTCWPYRGKKGHGSVYLRAHMRFYVCAYVWMCVCTCAYGCVYTIAHSHIAWAHKKIKDTTHLWQICICTSTSMLFILIV